MNKKLLWTGLTLIPLLAAAVLWFMGRELICTCGYVKLWHGIVISSENSQHIFDWYTFTHIVHGLGFYLLMFVMEKISKRKIPFLSKLLIAIFLESSWEILENTNYVINRYRAATISLDYFGDSVVNSIADILAMIVGFIIAYKKPLFTSIAVFLVIEAALLLIIRDNLTLNILMLIHPLEAVKLWQGGG